jgi:crossover junction endodeoxyribonuclease RuvC
VVVEERALGIDPGSRVTGWGVVERDGARLRAVECGAIRLGSSQPLGRRLDRLHAECLALFDAWRPTLVALERAFVARNVQSAFRIGEVRGVVLAAAAARDLPVFEYAPTQVKLAATGYGQAAKDAVGRGVALRLALPAVPQSDAGDALAVALCHLQASPLVGAVARARTGVRA